MLKSWSSFPILFWPIISWLKKMNFRICTWRTLFFSKFKKNFLNFSPSLYHVQIFHNFFKFGFNLLYFWNFLYLLKPILRYFNLVSRSFFIFQLFFAHILRYDIVNFRISNFIYPHFTLSLKDWVEIYIQVFNKFSEFFCKIFITDWIVIKFT